MKGIHETDQKTSCKVSQLLNLMPMALCQVNQKAAGLLHLQDNVLACVAAIDLAT